MAHGLKHSAAKRLPEWLKKPAGPLGRLHAMKKVLRERGLHTVCESARCPNIGECFTKPTATFLILGDVCTRRCGFCAVDKLNAPTALDPDEPGNVALAARELGLKHAVVTSVTRDDLADGGAGQFALTIRALKDTISGIFVEVLTPDFEADFKALDLVLDARPHIFNHNVETVRRLYPTVRPKADYAASLSVLERAAESGVVAKSGLMVGFGETVDEVKEVLSDLKSAGCRIVTIGQYLRPTKKSLEVAEYVAPEVFTEYEKHGIEIGIEHVYSGPLVRSSYNAGEVWKNFTA